MPITLSDKAVAEIKRMCDLIIDKGAANYGARILMLLAPKITYPREMVVRENQYVDGKLKHTTRAKVKVHYDKTGYFIWYGHKRRYLKVTPKGNLILRRDFKGAVLYQSEIL